MKSSSFDSGISSAMDRLVQSISDKLYQQVKDRGVTSIPCGKCGKDTPVEETRPRIVSTPEANDAGRLLSFDPPDVVEVKLCCKECCKTL